MDDEVIRRLEQLLTEAACTEISLANGWLNLQFTNHRLILLSAWRLVENGKIVLAVDDDVESAKSSETAFRLLYGRHISTVSVYPPFHDLAIQLNNGATIQSFSNSCKYENWNFVSGQSEMITAGPNTLHSWFPPTNDS